MNPARFWLAHAAIVGAAGAFGVLTTWLLVTHPRSAGWVSGAVLGLGAVATLVVLARAFADFLSRPVQVPTDGPEADYHDEPFRGRP